MAVSNQDAGRQIARRWIAPWRAAGRGIRSAFAPLVWPGVGPSADLAANWPELLIVILAGLLFGWGAYAAGLPAAGGAALSAGLHPVWALPALLLGPLTGLRLAVQLSLVAAGLGMWWLGRVMGLGRAGRTWAGLVYAFAGAAASWFGQGQLGLAFGSAWIPWALAFLLAAARTQRMLHAALAAVSLALVLAGGHFGLSVAVLLSLAVLAWAGLVRLLLDWRRAAGHGRSAAVVGLVAAALGLGLAAVRLLPALAGGVPALGATGMAAPGAAGVLGALFSRPPAVPLGAATVGAATVGAATIGAETAGPIAYVGLAPLICLAGLAWPRGAASRLQHLSLAALLVFALALAGVTALFPTGLPAGMLAWATTALVALAGAGLDGMADWAMTYIEMRRVDVPAAVRCALARLALVALTFLVVLSVVDLYRTNHPLLASSAQGALAQGALAQGALAQGALAQGAPLVADPEGWPMAQALAVLLSEHPAWFWGGAAVSAISLIGILALIVGDVRGRRRFIETEALYREGVLEPAAPLGLPDGTPVHVTVTPSGEGAETGQTAEGAEDAGALAQEPAAAEAVEAAPGVAVRAAAAIAPGRREAERQAPRRRMSDIHAASRIEAAGPTASRIAWVLFALGLAVYAVTRIWYIEYFPIYFFTDEATFALLAEQLLANGLRDGQGTLLPLYFEVAGNRWTPVLAVYVHLPAIALFGKSVLVTRVTSAIVTLLTPISVALILRSVFRVRNWWAGALIVAVVPTWFLHSRTAFEWLMMASFYACFLLFYLLYRTRSPRWLFLAILFGAATFYNHASGQVVMAVVAVLLAASDFRYHLKNWRTVLLGLALVGLLAIPLLRMQAERPDALLTHLRAVDSYWFRDLPLADKLRQFVTTYAYGLSPAYWFDPSGHDLVRHLMKGYGHLGWVMLPLVIAGALLVLWRVRSAPHRAVLLAALAAPAGAATAEVAITRMMAFIPPICIVAGLGLDLIIEWIRKLLEGRRSRTGGAGQRSPRAALAVSLAAFALLSAAGLWMLRDAVVNGPTWYRDYGLYGMQYGARQLFEEAIPSYLAGHPESTVVVSPSWANGTDSFVRFFLPPEQQFTRVQMHDVRYYMFERRELGPNMTLVLTPEEYQQAAASGKFKSMDVDLTVPYPDGRTGFYFARLAYADNLEEILAAEREVRSRPVTGQIELDGQMVEVRHSQLDMGALPNMFDGDSFTLVRGLEANPLVFDFTFTEPRAIAGLDAVFGAMDFALKAELYAEGASEPAVYQGEFRGVAPPPKAQLTFDRGPDAVSRLRLEILHLNAGGEVHIEARELKFR